MRLTICLAAAVAFCGLSTPALAKHTAKPTAFQIDGTSWTYTEKKDGKLRESIDADGNYITQTIGGKHIDHGTAVMKDDKACFTSAMTKDGEICWTTSPVKIGHSMHTVSDKGEKLTVTRVGYVKLSMPK
jgi:predicted PilT family ATPase